MLNNINGDDVNSLKQKEKVIYNALINLPGVGVIERDATKLLELFKELKNNGVTDLLKFLRENPDYILKLHRHNKVLNMNDEATRILGSFGNKNVIIDWLSDLYTPLIDPLKSKLEKYKEEDILKLAYDVNPSLKDYLITFNNIFKGLTYYERIAIIRNMSGVTKKLLIKSQYPTYEFPYILTILIDISEKEEKEKKIASLEKKYYSILNNSPIGIVISQNQTILYVNRAITRMYGYTKNEIIGEKHSKFQSSDYQPYLLTLNKSRESGKKVVSNYKSIGVRKDGTKFPIEVFASNIEINNSIGTVGFIIDITEKEKIQKQLIESHKLESLGLLAGGIAHDYNNLLLAIKGATELLRYSKNLDENDLYLLDLINKTTEQASSLTKQLLMYSGKSKIQLKKLNISDVIKEQMGLIRLSVRKEIDIIYNLDYNISPIFFDVNQLNQIIINLVINSADAINGVGAISISTSNINIKNDDPLLNRIFSHKHMNPGNYVMISVEDNGVGISSKQLEKIFDPFYSTKSHGRGLGLSVIIGILSQYNGGVSVNSTPGIGTTFNILIPIKENTDIHENNYDQTSTEDSINFNNLTALIVDDETNVQKILSLMLNKLDVKTIVATNGADAIAKYKKYIESIDFIILDLSMPVLSGIDTLKELRRINANIPVIISSGYSENAIDDFDSYDNIIFLPKPYSIIDLKQSIVKLISSQKLFKLNK